MPTTPPTSTPSPTVAQGGLADLAEFQWANRLIVMFAAPAAVAELQATLIAEDAAVIDRQILWFIVADDVVTTNYGGALSNQLAANLRSRYAQLDTDLEVVLIGKDSGVKNRQPFLDSAAIYGQIDEMPMRRAEMTKQAAP